MLYGKSKSWLFPGAWGPWLQMTGVQKLKIFNEFSYSHKFGVTSIKLNKEVFLSNNIT